MNNKMMLLLLSVFPILLLLFALELELFALAVLTQGSHSPKLCISTICKIEQLLTEMLRFSHTACTHNQFPVKQLENIPEERRNTSFSLLPLSDKMRNRKSMHTDSSTLAQACLGYWRNFLP